MASTLATISNPPVQFNYQINTTLTSDNYLPWKSQICAILKGHGLIAFIDGSLDPPSPTLTSNSTDGSSMTSPNPEFVKWYQQDQLILAWIFNSLSPSILAQVINCESSRQLWTEINQLHTSQSMARVLELKLKLQTSKKGGSTCAQSLQHMQEIADHLRSIGSDITVQDLVLYTLQVLGTDFESFVTAISMRSNPVSMNKLRSLLLSHEARQQANLASLTSSMTNLSVASTDKNSSGSSAASALYADNKPNQPYHNTNSLNSQRGTNSYSKRGRGYSSSRSRSLNLWDPFDGLLSFPFDTSAFVTARIDWKETPEAHVFKADLPGVNKGEVKLEVEEGNILWISGERTRENEEKSDTWHHVERSSGKFLRRFKLPENAKMDQIKVAMANGVLTVTVVTGAEFLPNSCGPVWHLDPWSVKG